MASLVSHPDEIRVVSRRFGQGATNLDRYLELDGYKAVQKALSMQPDDIVPSPSTFFAMATRVNLELAKTGSSSSMIRMR